MILQHNILILVIFNFWTDRILWVGGLKSICSNLVKHYLFNWFFQHLTFGHKAKIMYTEKKISTCILSKKCLPMFLWKRLLVLCTCVALNSALPSLIREFNPIFHFTVHLIVSLSYERDCAFVPLIPIDSSKC